MKTVRCCSAKLALLGALFAIGCTTGEGTGFVHSDRLFVEGCWNGTFDLGPDFFGANPFREEAIFVRVQRGDDLEELSDGLIVLVNDPRRIRGEDGSPGLLGQAIDVGLPPGVSPPGVPLERDGDPPLVSLTLYLNQTCHLQNGALHAVGGTITFESLFSGDVNEPLAEDRLTEATFDVDFADPRSLESADESELPDLTSRVSGAFRFFFQRGQPAQPFP